MPSVAEYNKQHNIKPKPTLDADQIAELEAERSALHRKNVEIERTNFPTPFTAYNFLVYFEDADSSSIQIQGAFTNFSGVRMSNQIAKFRSGCDLRGVKNNYPGITEYEHAKLTKGVIGNSDFLDWLFKATIPDAFTGPKGENLYRNIHVCSLLEYNMEPGMEWVLLNAIPVGYELHPMDANQSSYLSEEIEIAFTGVVRNRLWKDVESSDK